MFRFDVWPISLCPVGFLFSYEEEKTSCSSSEIWCKESFSAIYFCCRYSETLSDDQLVAVQPCAHTFVYSMFVGRVAINKEQGYREDGEKWRNTLGSL